MATNNNIKKNMRAQKTELHWIVIISIIFCQVLAYLSIRTHSTQTILAISSFQKQLVKKTSYQKALFVERDRLKADKRITSIAKTKLNLVTATLSQTIYLPVLPASSIQNEPGAHKTLKKDN